MATATLEKVIEEVKSLTVDEKRRLRELLDGLLAGESDAKAREQQVIQQLLADGIISRIPEPITDFTPYENRKPIHIEGKPL